MMSNTFNRSNNVFVLLLALFALLGSVIVLFSTTLGPGLREDSFSYFTAADSFYQGTGLGRWAADGTFRPLTHFPPLLPVVLAAFKFIGLDFELSSRLLNASLYAVTSVVLGFLILRLSGSKIVALIGVALSSLSGVLIINHAWAHSEPLYLSLSLINLMSLAIYMKSPARYGSLVLAIFTTSLTFLSRFAGIAIIGSSTIALLILPWASRRKRLTRALVYALLSSTPTLIFVLRNAVLYGSASDRPLPIWHPPSFEKWLEGARTMLSWFLPYRAFSFLPDLIQAVLAFSLLLILSGMIIYTTFNLFKLSSLPSHPALFIWHLSLLNAAGYIALILGTVFFLDRLTPLNDRILSPIYLYLLVILPVTIYKIWANQKRNWVRLSLLFATFLFITVHAYRGIQAMLDLRHNGLGLSSPQWRDSETMEYLRSLAPSVPMYSNDIPAIYFHADRMANFIPVKQNPAEGTTRQDYPVELLKMRQTLLNGDGILVLFGSDPESRLHTAELSDLIVGLEEISGFEDAIVYRSYKPE